MLPQDLESSRELDKAGLSVGLAQGGPLYRTLCKATEASNALWGPSEAETSKDPPTDLKLIIDYFICMVIFIYVCFFTKCLLLHTEAKKKRH